MNIDIAVEIQVKPSMEFLLKLNPMKKQIRLNLKKTTKVLK